MRAENLPVGGFSELEELIGRLRENVGLARAEITGRNAAGFGVSSTPRPRTRDVGGLLAEWIGAAPSPLVILLDEAQSLDRVVGLRRVNQDETSASIRVRHVS